MIPVGKLHLLLQELRRKHSILGLLQRTHIKFFVFWVSLTERCQDECPQDEEVI